MKILDIPQVGKLGLTVTFKGRNGQIRRQWVVPANPRTAPQLDIRGRLATQAARFDSLTPAQQDAWTAAAALVQSRPTLGQSGPLTGLQLFTKINCTLGLFGQDLVDAPPAKPTFGDNAPTSLVITNNAGVIAIKLTCPANPGENTVVRAGSPQRSGVRTLPPTRILGMCPAPVTQESDITSLYTAKFGAPTAGQRLFVQVQQMTDGWFSPASVFNALVPAST